MLSYEKRYKIAKQWNLIDGINENESLSFEQSLKNYTSIDRDRRVMFIMKDAYSKDSLNDDLLFNADELLEDSFEKMKVAYDVTPSLNPVRYELTGLSDNNGENRVTFSKVAAASKFIAERSIGESSFVVDSTYNQYTKNIAFININKELWGQTSRDPHIKEAYLKYRDVLLSQIIVLDPGVIIFCGTFKFFKDDLIDLIDISCLELKNLKYDKSAKQLLNCYECSDGDDSHLFIETYHPRWWNKSTPYLFNQAIEKWKSSLICM